MHAAATSCLPHSVSKLQRQGAPVRSSSEVGVTGSSTQPQYKGSAQHCRLDILELVTFAQLPHKVEDVRGSELSAEETRLRLECQQYPKKSHVIERRQQCPQAQLHGNSSNSRSPYIVHKNKEL